MLKQEVLITRPWVPWTFNWLRPFGRSPGAGNEIREKSLICYRLDLCCQSVCLLKLFRSELSDKFDRFVLKRICFAWLSVLAWTKGFARWPEKAGTRRWTWTRHFPGLNYLKAYESQWRGVRGDCQIKARDLELSSILIMIRGRSISSKLKHTESTVAECSYSVRVYERWWRARQLPFSTSLECMRAIEKPLQFQL